MVKLFGSALGAMTLAAGIAFLPARTPTLSDTIAGYRKWHKINDRPIHMAPQLALLCSAPPKWHSDDNPHNPKFFTVYVNATGEGSMLSKKSIPFPVGSVIVKEKLPSANGSPELLTVMVKRGRGFDAAHGDWQYFTADGSAKKTSTEDIAKCQSCHDASKANDYVFRTYVEGAPRPRGGY
jgi:hypothetical protein